MAHNANTSSATFSLYFSSTFVQFIHRSALQKVHGRSRSYLFGLLSKVQFAGQGFRLCWHFQAVICLHGTVATKGQPQALVLGCCGIATPFSSFREGKTNLQLALHLVHFQFFKCLIWSLYF